MYRNKNILSNEIFQSNPGLIVSRLKKKENVIESGLQKQFKIIFIIELQAIGKKPADLTVLLCMSNQVRQIVAQRGFTACKCDMRNTSLPGFVQDHTPFVSCQFAVDAFGWRVFNLRVLPQTIRQRTVEAERGGQIG